MWRTTTTGGSTTTTVEPITAMEGGEEAGSLTKASGQALRRNLGRSGARSRSCLRAGSSTWRAEDGASEPRTPQAQALGVGVTPSPKTTAMKQALRTCPFGFVTARAALQPASGACRRLRLRRRTHVAHTG